MKAPIALITGASRGIGRGIALSLAQNGYDIAGLATAPDPAIREKGLYEVKERVEALGQRFLPVQGDVSDLDCHARVLDEVAQSLGPIALLVNNAGVSLARRFDITGTTSESYDRVMGINLRGAFFLTQAVVNRMLADPGPGALQRPAIVFITSISAHTASVNRAEYCVSKAGLSMTAQLFAIRLADQGINVYEIQPGVIHSDMTAGVSEKYDRLIAEGLVPQKRWGTPGDVGKAVASLARGDFDYATGAVIEVGGGFGLRRL